MTQECELEIEIHERAIDIIENIAVTHGYKSDHISHMAIGVILQAIAEEAYDAGIASTEEWVDDFCFRNQN